MWCCKQALTGHWEIPTVSRTPRSWRGSENRHCSREFSSNSHWRMAIWRQCHRAAVRCCSLLQRAEWPTAFFKIKICLLFTNCRAHFQAQLFFWWQPSSLSTIPINRCDFFPFITPSLLKIFSPFAFAITEQTYFILENNYCCNNLQLPFTTAKIPKKSVITIDYK